MPWSGPLRQILYVASATVGVESSPDTN
jgi:hypothetical protein